MKYNFFYITFKKLLNHFLDIIYFFRKNTKIYFTGLYESWEAAKKDSLGYDDKKILKKVKYSTSLLLAKKIVYERDGTHLKKKDLPYQILLTVLLASMENKHKCKVIDFGGSLGSTYYNNRDILKNIKDLKWIVVEQDDFVKEGNKYFSNKIINFSNTIEEASRYLKKPNVIIASGSIQYLPNPYLILEKIIQTKADYIVIDRSPFLIKGKTKLTIQKIPKTIVDSSYPIWLFNETEFKKIFKKKYQEITTFDALDGVLGYGKLKANYKGIIYKRI
jgi:putative methyltransferase (TIGR04325 family)